MMKIFIGYAPVYFSSLVSKKNGRRKIGKERKNIRNGPNDTCVE